MANRYYSGPASDHFDGERFFNPGLPLSDKTPLDVLRWKMTSRVAKWPESIPQPPQAVPDAEVSGLRITMIGHASLLVQSAGVNVLVDPVYSGRVSPFARIGPKRHTRPGIAWQHLPRISAVLVSHNHYDHLDTPTLHWLHAEHHAPVYTPLGNAHAMGRASGLTIVEGDWGSSFDLGPSIRLHLVRANHWSSRWLGDRRKALWCGFVLETPAGAAYLAGDTAYGGGTVFREVRERFGPPLVAVLPIGAYAPRWFMKDQHMDPAEAVRAMQDLGASHALGMHWGTFQLTDEPWDEPPALLSQALAKSGILPEKFTAMRPGDVWMDNSVFAS